ncbi:myelin-associated glycoprotein-like isoform X1 [Betta splendens]|uniref:Myelin-associated glycoprotein-like isoform X1 n=1 Tax=Betta splendens TaxID=158456 RepID=A0A9W2XBV6_BETSP|nr:myelin-associated glycoprotein-like isoform X1 [Betta splendens]XP_055359110.1 myelin-associated glycoprotein-like isoform X1 [Betta splendens]
MAAALILLFAVCLLPGSLCREFKVILPPPIEVLNGSCVTVPCSFDIEETYDEELDHTCAAEWFINKKIVFNSKTATPEEGKLLGNLTNKECTTTLNRTPFDNSTYEFRLKCQILIYSFTEPTVTIVAKADPPRPTLSPSTLEVRAGASVTLSCSAPAPCLSLPPHITWTSGLGDSQETMKELEDKTQVKTSVLNVTISRLHHKKEISCTAAYSKGNGDTASAVSTLTAVVSFPPQILDSSICTTTPSEVTCSCETEGNPLPTVYWYLNGTRLSHSDTFTISTEAHGDTGLKSIITVCQSDMKHRSILVCNSSNSLSSISQHLYNNSYEEQGHVQTTLTVITVLVGLLLVICALLVIIGIRTKAAHCSSPKRQSTGGTSSAALSHFESSTEANELNNTEEEAVNTNLIQIRQADVLLHTSGGASRGLEKNEDRTAMIYSTLMVKSERKKQQQQQQ